MSVLFTFPGQGAQVPDMLRSLPDHSEVARALDAAEATLGLDPLTLDSSEALQSTRAVQLCLLIAGVAMARVLTAQHRRPDMTAGFSIGAFPAAVISGALAFEDALALVDQRGRLMESSFPRGYGMAAVIGLDRFQLAPLIAEVHSADSPLYLANINAERQLVIAGAEVAIRRLTVRALELGATRVEPLAVSVPSHTPLMKPAAGAMRVAFSRVELRAPQMTLLSSSAARGLFDPSRIAEDLATNMAVPVQWYDTVRLAWERGARLAVEMPSSSVLTRLTQPSFSDGLAVSCDDTRLETLVALMAKEQESIATQD